MDYVTPAGFRDVLSDEACMRERIARDVQACFAARGYLPIETPTLEVMDVMRAGGRMPGSPFKFFDASGDLLAMRPDVTLQVARMCATRLAGQPGPFRFRYMQRVFREAEGRMQAQAREMTQIGVECIGEAGPQADAEVVELMVTLFLLDWMSKGRQSMHFCVEFMTAGERILKWNRKEATNSIAFVFRLLGKAVG